MMFFTHSLTDEEIQEIESLPNPQDYAIRADVIINSRTLLIQRGDGSLIKAPFDIFEPTGNGIIPSFLDFEIIDYGQTLRLGLYEAAFDAVIEESEIIP